MKAKLPLLFLCFFAYFQSHAQLADGSIAPDWTMTDIEGNSHNLYSILDEGKSVVIDIMATWCGPCWSYHHTDRLKTLYNNYGPDGTDEIMVFMIEASSSTNEACLYGTSGCSGSTYGDWVTGTPYPIIHISGSNGAGFNSDYNLAYYPTLYKICPNRKIYEVGQPPLQTWINWVSSCNLEATGEATSNVCFEDSDAAVNLDVSGGYGNISFLWSNGMTTEDLLNLPAGDYSCTITEGQGHSIEVGPFTVEAPDAPLLVNLQNLNDVSCNGDNNGSIDIEVNGGQAGYSYQWNNGSTQPDLNGISGGTYTLTVTDNLGCTETFSANVEEPPLLTMVGSTLDENCDQTDGSILLFAGGGNGDYWYDIGNGPSTNNIFQNLSAGLYTATVTDFSGCSTTAEFILENTPGPEVSAGEDQTVDCSQSTVQLDGSNSSNGPTIVYTWTTTDGNIVEGEDTPTPTVDQPGNLSFNHFRYRNQLLCG